MKNAFALALAFLTLIGCSTVRAPQSTREPTTKEADDAWRAVLNTYVTELGQIGFRRLAQNIGPLETYIQYVSSVSPASRPQLFKTPEARLAYYINSYNALSMYNVCNDFRTGKVTSLVGLGRVQFFYLRKFVVGGEPISLYDYERNVIVKEGDERVHFALNCMTRGCPRLPRVPFKASTLDEDLDAQAAFFLNEDRNVRMDDVAKEVHVSQIFERYSDDFLRKAKTLIAYMNLYRVDKIPAYYKIVYNSYDWAVNLSPDNSVQ